MYHANEVETFVHQCFEMYGLSFKQFFSELVNEDEDEEGIPYGGELVEMPIAIGDRLDMELLAKAATSLGVAIETLLEMDKQAARVWREQYPYFELKLRFETLREHSLRFNSSPETMLVSAIFNDDYHPDNYKRYKWDNIKARLIDLLKSYKSVMPECYHEDAEITKLTIETNNFTHFEEIEALVNSYLSMVTRARELFYKLWDVELPENEIREYNFLVSVLGMRDAGYSPTRPIYYDTAKKFAPIYKQEGYKEYSSYITYDVADLPVFYMCKEFYDHPDLIERMVQEFPKMKAEIGQMAILTKNYLCSFVWSDEPMPTIDASFDKYLVGMLRAFGDDTPSWYHRIYVLKSESELNGDEEYISICEKLAAPASKGGLKLPVPEYDHAKDTLKRIRARFEGESYNG